MSAEIVEGPDGQYVVTGYPGTGYEVRPVGQAVASYERKVDARRAVRSGEVRAAENVKPSPDVLCDPPGSCGRCWGCRRALAGKEG